jgi:hypothetical protein
VKSMLRLVLACLLIGLVAVPAADAASTTQILRDCADDGVLQGTYTPSELRKARKNIPTDTDEYTDCRDVLARAATAAVAGSNSSNPGGGGDGTTGGGASTGGAGQGLADPHTPEGREIVGQAGARGAPDAIDIGGRAVVPGNAGFASGAVRNGLPGTLIAVLVLLGAAAVAASVPFVRRSVIARFKR